MNQLSENVWILSYPLNLLGVDIRRNVTVLRLPNSQVLIHSTGPFSREDAASIRDIGKPTWLVEAMLRHDTFTQDGLTAFPGIPYLAPEGFGKLVSYPTGTLFPPPREWAGHIEVIELQGVPSMRETVMLHRESRTLIVADLAFNFPRGQSGWQELLLKFAVGKNHAPGISRSFRVMVSDDSALKESIEEMMSWEFDRLIVGHGEPIESGAKEQLRKALNEAKLL
jgi:hypothetical protein